MSLYCACTVSLYSLCTMLIPCLCTAYARCLYHVHLWGWLGVDYEESWDKKYCFVHFLCECMDTCVYMCVCVCASVCGRARAHACACVCVLICVLNPVNHQGLYRGWKQFLIHLLVTLRISHLTTFFFKNDVKTFQIKKITTPLCQNSH